VKRGAFEQQLIDKDTRGKHICRKRIALAIEHLGRLELLSPALIKKLFILRIKFSRIAEVAYL
jgi:hypothetical protein